MEFCNSNRLRYFTRDSCCGSLLGDSGREEMGQTWGAGVQRVTCWCGGRPLESTMDQGEAPRKLPQSIRRRWSYKQAVSKAAEKWHHMDDEALTPPCTKTALPVCPGRKVVQPVRMFLQTVRKKQMLVTLTSASRPSVMKSFMKSNTVHHLDAEEKELQQLENLKKKEEAELLRKQKVEEDQHQRLEEMKMKREEHLWKALKARKQAEQLEVEKKKRTEQKLEAKQKPLAKKASKKTARKLEEAEMMLKQEEEAWRQTRLQQQEEEREQKRQRKVAEALRNAVQQRQRERQLALEREMQRKREEERLQAEWERALQLHKERLLKELEEEQKREQDQRQEQEPKKLQKEQEKKAKEAKVVAAAAGAPDRWLDVTTHVQLWQPKGPRRDKEVSFHLQTPVGNSSEMTPQGPKGSLKIIPDSDGMDLCSDDSTDDEFQPGRPIPAWATGFQLRQATIYQYYVPPDIDQIFGTILSPDLEDIFQKSKPRYHTRTSSALWDSPPLARVPEFEGTVV
ncbi:inner centromere protein-like isoform X4 [Notamacropus eugenii]|uniref:inner centromere protein-like isoform X4 n=1 Tax=Notamacropus eugenii TaxID=9315 RepID=UPI003B681FE3